MELQTNCNFKIFNKKNFQKERALTLQRVDQFYQKYQKIDLRKPKNLLNFLKDYEKLISSPPGIFDKEYTYYFLKNLLDLKNKKVEEKLKEIRKLRNYCFEKIFSLLNFLKDLDQKEQKKILNSKLLKNYKKFLEEKVINYVDGSEVYQIKDVKIFRRKIDDEFKKYKDKLFEDKNLQDKILKKYLKLAEKAINKTLAKYPEAISDIPQKILKDIKNYVSKNKKFVQDFLTEIENKKEKIDSFLKSKISLQEFISLTQESFNEINKDFGRIVLDCFQKGLVDVYPKKNKYLTPRNVPISKFLPPFILLNFENNFASSLQIPHELMHYLHTQFLRKYNSPLNAIQNQAIRESIAFFAELLFLENLKRKYPKFSEAIDVYVEKLKINSIFYKFVLFLTIEKLYQKYKIQKKVSIQEINRIFKKNLEFILGKDYANKTSDLKWILDFSKGIFWHFPYLIGNFLGFDFLKSLIKIKNLLEKIFSNF